MHPIRWTRLLLALVFLFAVSSVLGQDPASSTAVPRSHMLKGLGDIPDNPEQLFANRKLLQQLLSNDKLTEQLKHLSQKEIDQLKKGWPQFLNKLGDAELEKLNELINCAQQHDKEKAEKDIRDLVKKTLEAANTSGQADKGQPGFNPNGPERLTAPPPLQPTPAQPPDRARRWREFVTRQLSRAAEGLEAMDQTEDTAALREALRRLSRLNMTDDGIRLDQIDSKHLDALDQVAKALSLDSLGSLNWNPGWQGGSPPSWAPALPTVQLPNIAPPSWSGSVSATASSYSNASMVLPWIAIVLLIGVLVWKYGGLRANPAGAGQPTWQVGDWPVAPGIVTTRGDLVCAFEYLALRCLGPAAAACHHHRLADQLGRDALERQQAAETLAQLYEQARYAPEQADATVPLSSADQAAARRALSLLAGGNAA